MCGLFGLISQSNVASRDAVNRFVKLAKLSERRGSDASGLIAIDNKIIDVTKCAAGISKLLDNSDLKNVKCIFGHSRLSTHGESTNQINNQPTISENWLVLHNGIITNSSELSPEHELDTFAINKVLGNLKRDFNENEAEKLFNLLHGETSVLALDFNGNFLAYSNVGGIYMAKDQDNNLFFASEQIFLKKIGFSEIEKLQSRKVYKYQISDIPSILNTNILASSGNIKIESNKIILDFDLEYYKKVLNSLFNRNIRIARCRKCLLPINFPNITFDGNDVCNFCNEFTEYFPKGLEKLEQVLSNSIDRRVLVNLSGGRDSCYLLHKICEMGFKPTAFTYDWGFISTAARENMSKMCAALNVEHIVISPNIAQNRKIVHAVLDAWLKDFDPATIPLLMAGDKPFIKYSMRVAKENGGIPIVHGDHALETTHFKSALAGAKVDFQGPDGKVKYRLSLLSLFRMSFKYARLVAALTDMKMQTFRQLVLSSFIYYASKHNFVSFYEYASWNDKEIELELEKYEWGVNSRNSNQVWRMGDTTSPVYNLLYLVTVGYTENDALLSNKIRANLISREEAITELEKLNQIDFGGINSYLNLINFDVNSFWEKVTLKLTIDQNQSLQN